MGGKKKDKFSRYHTDSESDSTEDERSIIEPKEDENTNESNSTLNQNGSGMTENKFFNCKVKKKIR